jgi:ribosomal protein S18 acetylase RimI-like enzyme
VPFEICIRSFIHEYKLDWQAMVRDYDPDLSDQDIESTWIDLNSPHSGARIFMAFHVQHPVPKPIGFLQTINHRMLFHARRSLYISDLYVVPAYRRKRVGSKLMDHAFELAANMGVDRVQWITDKDNPARPLYDQYGDCKFVFYYKYV